MFNNYYDCKNLCEYTFGKNNICLDCSYYKDCIIEKEISDYEKRKSKALNRQLSRIEDGDFL